MTADPPLRAHPLLVWSSLVLFFGIALPLSVGCQDSKPADGKVEPTNPTAELSQSGAIFPVESTGDTLRESLAEFDALPLDELVEAIPEQAGIVYITSPATDTGSDGWLTFDWAGPADPSGIVCKGSGLRFPNSEFPADRSLSYVDGSGTSKTADYFEFADGKRAFFGLHADYQAKIGMAKAAQWYADSWRLTGNADHGQRAARILVRFAEVFPGYVPWHTHPEKTEPRADLLDVEPDSHDVWLLSYWRIWTYQALPDELLRTFDSIRGTGLLDPNEEAQIERDIFDRSLRVQLGFRDAMTNADPHTHQSLILAGRILNRPELVNLAVERMLSLANSTFFYDGMWKEGTVAYHQMALGHLAKAFSFLGDADRERPEVKNAESHLERLKIAERLLVGPTGLSVRTGDDWGSPVSDALQPEGLTVLGGVGHVRMATGEGPERVETHLHFSGEHGHGHADPLSLILFGGGEELLPDIGYSHTFLRPYTTGTMSHNTVVVDGKNSRWANGTDGGVITLLGGEPSGPLVVEAQQLSAYPRMKDYRRRLIQIPAGTHGAAYTVDIFSVDGGSTHDYFLHGFSDGPASATISANLPQQISNLAGTPEIEWPASARDFRLEEQNFYSLFRDVTHGKVDGDFTIDWKIGDDDTLAMKTWILGAPGREVFWGETPQVRPANRDDGRVKNYWRPSLMVRSNPTDGKSVFVAIHEPNPAETQISGIELLQTEDQGGLVLRVTHADGVDTILSSTERKTIRFEDIQVDGLLAVVRESNGELESVFQCDSPTVDVGGKIFKSHAAERLEIASVDNENIQVHAPASLEGQLRPGQWFLAELGANAVHAYRVEESSSDGKVVTIKTGPPPGFRLDGARVEETAFPNRRFRSSPTVTLQNSVTWTAPRN